MKDFERGDIIDGKYEVTKVLGQGGMGVVVAVRHRQLGELFALKFLLPGLEDRVDSLARFYFGIAKSNVTESPSVTASSATPGTALYMSPEQLSSSKEVDARTDVWSMGLRRAWVSRVRRRRR